VETEGDRGRGFGEDLYMEETSISVDFTSFMAAVVFFFIGLLLTGSPGVQVRLRIPLVFLFISAMGFLYSTIIYANASGELARLRKHEFDDQITMGNIISEYLGVYCLVFAIPLAILGYSPDRVLALVIVLLDSAGFWFYHYMGYSILERYVGRPHMHYIVGLFVGLYLMSFFGFYFGRIWAYYGLSSVLLALVFAVTFFSVRKGRER